MDIRSVQGVWFSFDVVMMITVQYKKKYVNFKYFCFFFTFLSHDPWFTCSNACNFCSLFSAACVNGDDGIFTPSLLTPPFDSDAAASVSFLSLALSPVSSLLDLVRGGVEEDAINCGLNCAASSTVPGVVTYLGGD